jgi:hypothetical protein
LLYFLNGLLKCPIIACVHAGISGYLVILTIFALHIAVTKKNIANTIISADHRLFTLMYNNRRNIKPAPVRQ